MTQRPWPETHSLLREELLDLPAGVFGDPRVDAPVQALLAGEPQRALALLAAQPPDPRSAVALTAWARQSTATGIPVTSAPRRRSPPRTPSSNRSRETTRSPCSSRCWSGEGRPVCARRGRCWSMALRSGAMPGVQQALGYAAESVDVLSQYATQMGQQALLPWLTLMRADFSRRAGLQQDADALLAQARQQATSLQSPPRLALTYLVEGDWYAAPGSSPECLGWDLGPMNAPNPLPPRDLPRAAALWDQADACSWAGTSPGSGRRWRSGARGRPGWPA